MAATWIKSLHKNVGKSLAKTLAKAVDYIDDLNKTDGGTYVTSFGCEPRSAEEEFLISKLNYGRITGRKQKSDVIAYHIRQSFKPGEIDAQTANEIGRKLAESFFKGKHLFVVATHVDRRHIHNHILVNSTTIDCTHKFKDFKRSGKVVRKISDLLCVEYGLSVIENPKPSKGRNYGKWLGDNKPISWSEKLRRIIDEILPSCTSFDDLIVKLKEQGITVREGGKYISLVAPGQGRPIRLKSLGADYSEEKLNERIVYEKPSEKENFLITIQSKIREASGRTNTLGTSIFNLKQAAKTLIFLEENGIKSFDELVKIASEATTKISTVREKIRAVEDGQKTVSELQKQIGVYSKTRATYASYKASGWSKKFYDENAGDIILHRAAKQFFDEQNIKKLPKIAELRQEWATLNSEKNKLYSEYHKAKDEARELLVAKDNAAQILGESNEPREHETAR